MATQEFSEQQLIQMARGTEAELNQRQAILEKLGAAMRETNAAVESLTELKKNKDSIMVRIGSGILIEAEAKEIKKCKRAFSENGYIEENTEDTLKWLEKRKIELQKQMEKVEQELSAISKNLSDLMSILNQIQAEKRKNFSGQ
ncbi:MAG: hypothetical protein WC308_00850 [archaeon]|jgi:prefoldin alpha subunit